MRKTKIVCTVGPACRSEETFKQMIESGMNVARINFSHGDHEYHSETLKMLKNVREALQTPLALMLDTKGPEVRLHDFENGKAELVAGAEFILTTQEMLGTEKKASVTFKDFSKSLQEDDVVLIDDGRIRLKVLDSNDIETKLLVEHGGTVSNHKGINVPNVHLDMPVLSEQDKKDLIFGVQNDVDFVAASFIRSKEDVITIRNFLNYYGGHNIRIISKIENREGLNNFEEILEHSDGIMVARGDMGVEIEYERLPGIQKRIIRRCFGAGKMVITATQMLDSMMYNKTPTRAEITDVANAVFDGTSAIMLSGETAAGKFPLDAVKTMAKIALQAEKDLDLSAKKIISAYETPALDITNAICDAACRAARDLNAQAIIALSKSGLTARNVSKFRPAQPIIAPTPETKTFHQLALSWGVYPVLARHQDTYDALLLHSVDCARQIDAVKKGDIAVIVAGVPLDTPGNANLIKIEVV